MPVPVMSATTRNKKPAARRIQYNIVKVNKDSPFTKINFTRIPQYSFCHRHQREYTTRSRISKFYRSAFKQCPDDRNTLFPGKIAQSSDEDAVSVQYIGSNMDADNSKQFDITVERLATPQVNCGVYLAPGASDFAPGNYSFDLNTNLSSYEFQYTISGRDTNETVQRKIMRLINNANIGLNATLVSNDRGQNALSITSQQTGLGDSESSTCLRLCRRRTVVPYAPCARSASTTSRKCRSIRSFVKRVPNIRRCPTHLLSTTLLN